MYTTPREQLAIKFANCMSRLKALGLKGGVAVTAGVVMTSTSDKGSTQGFRKAIKSACTSTGAVSTESRPSKGFYVFAITV